MYKTSEEMISKIEKWRENVHWINRFINLGSIIYKNGKTGEDVTCRSKSEIIKWKSDSKILCNRKILMKLSKNFVGQLLDQQSFMVKNIEQLKSNIKLKIKKKIQTWYWQRWECYDRRVVIHISNKLKVAHINVRYERADWGSLNKCSKGLLVF